MVELGLEKTQNQFAACFCVEEVESSHKANKKACQGDTRANLKDPLMAKSGTI